METTCSKCGSDGVIPRHLPKGEHIPPNSGIHNIEKFSKEIPNGLGEHWGDRETTKECLVCKCSMCHYAWAINTMDAR